MKKVLMFTVFAIMILLVVGTSIAAASTDVPRIIMSNGFEISGNFIRMKDNKVYVSIGTFNNISGVVAFDDFGGTGGWSSEKTIPDKKTSVALLLKNSQLRNVTIVANKTTGEVFTEARGNVPVCHPALDAIFLGDMVYLPLRDTSNLLGATVDYDPACDTFTVKG